MITLANRATPQPPTPEQPTNTPTSVGATAAVPTRPQFTPVATRSTMSLPRTARGGPDDAGKV